MELYAKKNQKYIMHYKVHLMYMAQYYIKGNH